MVQARIRRGRVEVQDPIPPAWDGQMVKLVLLTPEDPLVDLDQRLSELHALGPAEFEPGEREEIMAALGQADQLSKEALRHLASHRR
jgi:hypothetical protein